MSDLTQLFVEQLPLAMLGILVEGMVVAALGSQLASPDSTTMCIRLFLLIRIGLTDGIAICIPLFISTARMSQSIGDPTTNHPSPLGPPENRSGNW